MVKKSVKIYLCMIILIISILSLMPLKIEAATSSAGGYTIQSYDIDMVVNDDNTFDITEKIKVNFSSSRHGIFRKLPLKNSIIRNDGTKSNNRATITNIEVSEEFSTYKENKYEVIKIGSASSTVVGKHTYTIKYKYGIGKDPLKNADELYFNLIGNEWDTSIENLSFKITMPKEFDKNLLGITSGSKGSTNTSNVYYNVNGNVISGYTLRTLNSGDGVTVRLTLPEGYFANAKSTTSPFIYLMIIVPVICLIITLILWYKYGKDDKVIETVEFYPPEGYNSAEISFLYKGKVEDNDIVSLLIYLANKGYLEIENTSKNGKFILSQYKKEQVNEKIRELENKLSEEKLKNINSPKIKVLENSLELYRNIDKPVEYSDLTKNSLIKKLKENRKEKFKIIKLKEYDGNNEIERIFFEGLFSKYSNKKSVTYEDLYNQFYLTVITIKALLNSKKNKDKIFESSTKGKSILVMTMIIISALLILIPKIIYSGVNELISFYIILLVFFIQLLFLKNKSVFSKIQFVVFCIPIILLTGFFEAIFIETVSTIGAVIWIICIIAMFILYNLMPKRTPYGNEILGKIKGFKRFLETAEKEKLEAMVMENPTYFYDILPYTYVLGISDKWISQFETIALQAPNWYSSTNGFNVVTFGSFMNYTMSSARTAMISRPSRSSGGGSSGGSSGGGSSGGGSGGGGGGSW